ncbi:hypothetical protein NKJ87_17850 [Mesorhizobium sp. M0027]|uniref:hypothetical protein n=1 Tax=Mesorhizobium sp. M0027 TaxID=2956848 RepID=UPI0033396B33
MALNSPFLNVVTSVTAKRQPARGIIPLEPLEIDPRDAAIFMVAGMINDALTGPAISVHDLAERIVDEVSESLMGDE